MLSTVSPEQLNGSRSLYHIPYEIRLSLFRQTLDTVLYYLLKSLRNLDQTHGSVVECQPVVWLVNGQYSALTDLKFVSYARLAFAMAAVWPPQKVNLKIPTSAVEFLRLPYQM